MHEINRRQALAWLGTTLVTALAGTLTAGCGGGGGDSTMPATDGPPSPPPNTAPTLRVTDYLGSLYQPFEWSGPIRDPYRDVVEIFDPAQCQPMTSEELLSLSGLLTQRDVIMQIGGMGSAKLNPDRTQINAQFKAYMDAIIADGAVAWRNAVSARATEVAQATPEGSRVYWQIGNEINAPSYQHNIDLYLNRSSSSLLEIIPIYVEYFLAPTAQAMRHAASDTGRVVRLALGSIAGFSNSNSQLFLDTLLAYRVVGTYAPELKGLAVSELVELITIHYLMNSATLEQPEYWREVLTTTRQKWLGVGAIAGIWSTEEVGIQAADAGKGGGSALRILSRYLGWISDRQADRYSTRWFDYGTTAGPANQRIDDAMTHWHELIGDHALQLYGKLHSLGNTLETYAFQVVGTSGWLLTVTALGKAAVTFSDVPMELPGVNLALASAKAWRYGADGTTSVNTSLQTSATGVRVRLEAPLTLLEPDTLLLWVGV